MLLLDEEIPRRLLPRLIGASHRVLCAAHSVEALQLARATHPDLLITDYLLDEWTTGDDVARELADEMPDMGIIFYTGFPAAILARWSSTLPRASLSKSRCRCRS